MMNDYKNKCVLVGVTGGIAAYKTPELVRRLKDSGCDVRVVLSQAAAAFITPLTLQAVSGHLVHQYLLDPEAESGMGHIELARWVDHIIVAPATANFIAKMAHGIADDLLSTLILATTANISIAPAMNQQMWQHPATSENLEKLTARGVEVIGPGSGGQACGETGPGRMTEPGEIAEQIAGDNLPGLLAGQCIMVTAGPTWEAIDPVRGITNHSSGKMGYALASAAADLGATVTLVSGPVHLSTPRGVNRIDVVSAEQMLQTVMKRIAETNIFIGVAAVADYRPKTVSEQKLKKSGDDETMTMEMIRNPDILATVAGLYRPPFTVGFAAETENIIENARKKLHGKNVSLVAANNVAGDDGAFGNDQNSIVLVHADGEITLPRADKYALARKMLEHIHQHYNNEAQK